MEDEKKIRIKKDLAALRRFLTAAESSESCDTTLDEILRVFKESVPLEHPSLKREHSIDRSPHVALLFSSPLVYKSDSEYTPLDSIPYESEKRILFNSFKESGRAVTYYEEQASVASFRAIIDRGGCRVLHFVGHGMQGENKDRDGLLVEGDCGRALEIDIETLSRLLTQRGKHSRSLIRLVFVSSCHSEEVGRVFLRAGVAEHVITVKRESSVLSDAACLFAHAFYRSYLCDSSVRDAFQHAKLQVSLSSFDPSQFLLMSSPASSEYEDKALEGIPRGDFVDMSRKLKFRDIPCMPDLVLGRNVDMYNVLDLLHTSRLVTIRGSPGIGKTTLAKQLLHYMAPRCIYADGLIFVNLRDVQTIDCAVLSLSKAVGLSTPLPTPDRSREPSRADSPMTITSTSTSESLTNADHLSIRPHFSEIFRRVQEIVDLLNDSHVLVYLDAAEAPLAAFPKAFRDLLTRLFEIPRLHILVSSRNSIGGGIPGTSERVYVIFRARCLRISIYDTHKHRYTLRPLSPLVSAELLCRSAPRRLRLEEFKIEEDTKLRITDPLTMLSKRPIIKLLEGHPQAIVLSSALLQDKSLQEVEHMFGDGHFNSSLQIVDISESQRSSDDTLRTSLQMSLNLIEKGDNRTETIHMFCVLGLLPGGAYKSDLEFVFYKHNQKEVEWKHSIDRLVRNSLIERVVGRGAEEFYRTFTFFCDFAEKDVLRKLETRISQSLEMYVAERMLVVVKNMFETYGFANDTHELEFIERCFPAYEKNVYACLRRMESRLQRKSTSKSSPSSSPSNKVNGNSVEHLIDVVKRCISKWKNSHNSIVMVDEICKILILMLGMESSLTTSEFIRRTDLVFRMRRIQWNKLKRWRIRYMLTQLRLKYKSRIQDGKDLDEVELFICMDRISAEEGLQEKTQQESKKTSSFPRIMNLEIATSELAAYFSSLLLLRERRDDAMDVALMGIRIARSSGDIFSEACLRKIAGVVLLKLRRAEEARKHLGKALILFGKLGSLHGRASCFMILGHVNLQSLKYNGVETCFVKAREAYRDANHLPAEVIAARWSATIAGKLPRGGKERRRMRLIEARRLQGMLNRESKARRELETKLLDSSEEIRNRDESLKEVMICLEMKVTQSREALERALEEKRLSEESSKSRFSVIEALRNEIKTLNDRCASMLENESKLKRQILDTNVSQMKKDEDHTHTVTLLRREIKELRNTAKHREERIDKLLETAAKKSSSADEVTFEEVFREEFDAMREAYESQIETLRDDINKDRKRFRVGIQKMKTKVQENLISRQREIQTLHLQIARLDSKLQAFDPEHTKMPFFNNEEEEGKQQQEYNYGGGGLRVIRL